MEILFNENKISKESPIAVAIYQGRELSKSAKKIDKLVGGAIKKAILNDKFSGKMGEHLTIHAPVGIDANRILCVGVGKKEDFNPLNAQNYGAKIVNNLKGNSEKSVKIYVDDDFAEQVAFGAYLAQIKNCDYKTDKDAKSVLETVVIIADKSDVINSKYDELKGMVKGIELARHLVSAPANDMTPTEFARVAKSLEAKDLKVSIYSEKELKDLSMNLMLSVAKGSDNEPKLVVVEYKGKKSKDFDVALVGKGVCFDTGGISIKPAKGMEDMKFDMAGAAAVLGTMLSLSNSGLKVNILGVMGMVENMPSAKATRPGDVVKSMSGKTVEIINTDAEGRLVLADLITYVEEKYNAKEIIELSTLTGAIIVALGKEYAGLFTNDDDLAWDLIEAGKKSGEKVWAMPSSSEYANTLKSDIADIKNMGVAGEAGSIAAAEFLKKFVIDGVKFAHIDIAGTAFCDRTKYDQTIPKGATGYGIRLLNQYIKDRIEKSSK